MKTIFEPDVREGLIRRIERLSENCAAGWGIMTPYQKALQPIRRDVFGQKKL